MDDTKIKRIISSAGDGISVPWEELWAVFQKVLQQMQEERGHQTNHKGLLRNNVSDSTKKTTCC